MCEAPYARNTRTQILLLASFQEDPDIRELIEFLYDELVMIVEDREKPVEPLREEGPVASWLKEVDERDEELRARSIEKIAIALDSMKFDDWLQDWFRRCILRLREMSTEKVMHDLILQLVGNLEENYEVETHSCTWCGAREIDSRHYLECADRRKLQG